MKTAMQELIEWGDEMLLKHPQKILGFGEAIDKAEKLLEKEKEQIKDAFEIGISEGLSMENNTLGYDANPEEYYNQTYNNEKD